MKKTLTLLLTFMFLANAGQTLPAPLISATGPTVTCDGSGVWLKSSAGSGNHWSTGAQDTVMYAITSGTYSVYQVVGTSTSAPSAVITVSILPAAVISPIGPLCHDMDSVLLGVQPPGGVLTGMGIKANYFYPPLVGVNNKGVIVTYHTSHFVDSYICSDSASMRIMVLDCTSLTDLTTQQRITVSPNPSQDLFFIDQADESFSVLSIQNTNGQAIKSELLIKEGKTAIHILAPAGVYTATVRSQNQLNHIRLVKL